MRDEIKDKNYFEKFLNENDKLIKRGLDWLEQGKVREEQIPSFKKDILKKKLYKVIAGYSLGLEIEILKTNFSDLIDYVNEGWPSEVNIVGYNKSYEKATSNQYWLYSYVEMLWMVSLGYLLDVPKERYEILADAIDKDNIKSILYEFILSAKLKHRKSYLQEPANFEKNVYETLFKAANSTDKSKTQQLLMTYLEKDWYKKHKDAGWYNSHKSKHDSYFGYWSFETAVIVKIMGIDDSSFRDCKYYPKDLVNTNM